LDVRRTAALSRPRTALSTVAVLWQACGVVALLS